MASTVSFKQACPSCEALVPIRDPKLVGKKTECPKCKYRFVVEEPEEEAPKKKSGEKGGDKGGGKKGKKDKEGAGKKKKADGQSSNTVLIGVGVGVVVIGLLAGVYFMFLSGPSTPKTNPQANNTTPIPPGPIPGPGPENPGMPPDGMNPGMNPGTPMPTPSRFPYAVRRDQVADISNLLPGETQGVWNLNVEKAYASVLGVVAFKTAGAFREQDFQKTFGFPLQEVQRIVVGVHSNWIYSVMRVKKPLDFNDLNGRLKLNKEVPENGRDWFTVGRDLDSFSNLMIKGSRPTGDLALCFADSQTLVFSNRDNVMAFLNASGQFPFKSQAGPGTGVPSPGGPTDPMMPGATPGGTMTNPMPMPMPMPMPGEPIPGPGGAGQPTTVDPGMPPKPGMPMPMQPGMVDPNMPNPGMPNPGMPNPGMSNPGMPNPGMPGGVSGSYLTIDPQLKNALDKAEGEKSVLFSRSFETRELFDEKEIEKALNQPDLPLPKAQIQAGIVVAKTLIKRAAIGLHELTEGKLATTITVDLFNEQIARTTEQQLRTALGLGQGGVNPGFPGGEGQPNPGFPMPPGGPGFPMGPGGPGLPMGPTMNLSSFLNLTAVEKTLVVNVSVPLTEPVYQQFKSQLEVNMLGLKSDADMANLRSRAHDLAAATQKYFKEKNAFPQGTVARAVPPGALVEWAPNQRLSWVVQLLPYLGADYAGLTIDPNLDWNEGDNLRAAQVSLPHLISRAKPGDSYRVTYPGRPEALGPTAWVGIAGVGLDAAIYRGDDPAVANKLGVFGYNRVTKREDIKDDLGQTILLIMVPPGQRAPWIIGGGGTVRGVSEDTESFRPFLTAQHPDTKEAGTYAIMADGKVRFLKATITPEQFRALCTIAGGEKVENLDAIAPVVAAPPGSEEETP